VSLPSQRLLGSRPRGITFDVMIKKIILFLILATIVWALFFQQPPKPMDYSPWLKNRVLVSMADAEDRTKVPPTIFIRTTNGFEMIEGRVPYLEKYALRYSWQYHTNVTISVSAHGYSTQIVQITKAQNCIVGLRKLNESK
jgi:hypothetical protein